jgi:hypothetical protein
MVVVVVTVVVAIGGWMILERSMDDRSGRSMVEPASSSTLPSATTDGRGRMLVIATDIDSEDCIAFEATDKLGCTV